MPKPSEKSDLATTCHRDGSVSYWDVYQQAWRRSPAALVSDQVLASLSSTEREQIARLAAR